MDFSIQNESGGTRHSPSEVLCESKAIDRLGSALDLRGLSLIFSSVENIPGVNAKAAFTVNSAAVFREDCDIMPSTFGNIKYMPWGADNQMPYDIIDLIERDETLATCQIFNAEICYGSGLVYDTSQVESRESRVESNVTSSGRSSLDIKQEVEDFQLDNDLASYFLGVCQDFKHFGFAVSVIILNNEGTKVVRLLRKEACYCRFAVADKRELYTIAQALQKPYHDLLFTVHRIIIRLNGWQCVKPDCPFVQFTTLDEHTDAKLVSSDESRVTREGKSPVTSES